MNYIIELDESDIQVVNAFKLLDSNPCYRCRKHIACCGCLASVHNLCQMPLFRHQKARSNFEEAERFFPKAKDRVSDLELPDWVFQPGSSSCRLEDMPSWAFPPGSWEASQ